MTPANRNVAVAFVWLVVLPLGGLCRIGRVESCPQYVWREVMSVFDTSPKENRTLAAGLTPHRSAKE